MESVGNSRLEAFWMDWGSMTGRILEMTILFCAINVDNKANFRYPDDYSFRLMQCKAQYVGLQLEPVHN
jgi:hypothetical protein